MTAARAWLRSAPSRLRAALYSTPLVESENWRTRDVFWVGTGLFMTFGFALVMASSPVLVIRAQSLTILIAATIASVFVLSRRGVLLPSSKALAPEAAADLARAKRGVGPLIALVLLTALALELVTRLPHLIVRPQLVVLALFWAALVFGASFTLTRAEAICLAAALTIIILVARQEPSSVVYFLISLALAAALHRLVLRRFDRLRMWAVRLMAGVVIAAGIYRLAFAFMGEAISVPLAVVLAILVGLDQRRDLRRAATTDCPWWRRPISLGAATFVAWIVFLGWAGWVDHELGAAGFSVNQWGRGDGPYPSTTGDPKKVAEAYEPLFVFAKRERWRPSDPRDYLREARVIGGGSCSDGRQPCVLTIDCPDADAACADERNDARRVVFARVVDDPLEAEGFDRAHAKAPLRKLTRLIQYWSFYRYDDWRRWQFDGWHQWHEADWEWVAVGLSDSGPLFAAYSAHCGGNWRTWKHLAALDGARDEAGTLRPLPSLARGRHPLAFVGQGTHAAYADGRERSPNWATCAKYVPPFAEAITWGPAHSINVREIMPVDADLEKRTFGPPVVVATEREPDFMGLRAFWGPANHVRTIWRGGDCPPQHPEGHCDTVAETPPMKLAWQEPIRTIFCNGWWHPGRTCPPRKR